MGEGGEGEGAREAQTHPEAPNWLKELKGLAEAESAKAGESIAEEKPSVADDGPTLKVQ